MSALINVPASLNACSSILQALGKLLKNLRTTCVKNIIFIQINKEMETSSSLIIIIKNFIKCLFLSTLFVSMFKSCEIIILLN